MTSHTYLQSQMAEQGFYAGKIDGLWGTVSKAACIAWLRSGPDYPLERQDFIDAGKALDLEPWRIKAITVTEANGVHFVDEIAPILFEPHRFSRATAHAYDASHPRISSRSWNKKLYPGSQQGRWDQLMDAVALDVDAGFASASYGAFQILGENFGVCGAASPFAFAWRQNQTSADQLEAFLSFIKGNKLIPALRAARPGDAPSCVPFVRRYNGTAFAENRYDETFAANLKRCKAAWG